MRPRETRRRDARQKARERPVLDQGRYVELGKFSDRVLVPGIAPEDGFLLDAARTSTRHLAKER